MKKTTLIPGTDWYSAPGSFLKIKDKSMKPYHKIILCNTIRAFILILLLLDCNSKPNTSEEDAAVAFFLLSSESNQSQNGNCSIRENSVITSGSPLVSEVNATSTRCWMLFSLNSGGIQVDPNSINWDLRLRRFVIGTNSGSSGSGQGGSCDTGLTDFANVTTGNRGNCATLSNFKVDSNQSQDGAGFSDVNDSASPVLFDWYTYNNTILTAKNNVYVIRDSKGTSFFKLQMLDYYSSSGTSGYPKFRWAKL